MSLLAETSALLGDSEPRQSYEVARSLGGAQRRRRPRGHQGLGLPVSRNARDHDGALDEAVRHFENALAMNERMGARPWLAHTQHDYARMLDARGDPGDRIRAQELLAEAIVTYRELGMGPHVARARAAVAAR